MPRVIGFESTPNPNAVKILLDGTLTNNPRSYREPPGDDCPDALAAALFAIDGVRVVLIHHHFVTVCKADKTPWSAIKRRAKSAIQAAGEAPPDA
ncbi:MAG: NifU N-terminal domain-containing protein [Phycisphaerales bacterium JB060]